MKQVIKYLFNGLFVIFNGCTGVSDKNFEFTYNVNLLANEGQVMKIWIPIPQSNAHQIISKLTIKTDLDYEIKREGKYGNKYLFSELANGLDTNKSIKISFKVKRRQAKPIEIGELNTEIFMKANRLVSVGGKFDSIVQTKGFKRDNMYPVYKFILDEMYYGKPKTKNEDDKYYTDLPLTIKEGISKDSVVELFQYAGEHNGEYTFGNGNSNYACNISVGNCTDFHSYFISLARTMKVPARFHIGFPIADEKMGNIGGYHCWADFEQDGEWIPVDISDAYNFPDKADFYYGNLDANRVEISQGRDLILEGYNNGPVNFFVYPIVESDGKSHKYFKEFFYKEL